MKRTFFRLLAFLLTAIAGWAQTQPAPLVSPEVHSDNRVTFRFRGPNIKEVAVSIEGNPKPLPMQKEDGGKVRARTLQKRRKWQPNLAL